MDEVYRKISRRLLPPLLLAYIVAYLDRVNVGFAKLQMLSALHFSETIYGLGAGIFFIGYFLFGVPSNMILRRVGARVWITTLMVFWGVVSAGMILIKTPGQYYALRFLLGVAEAGFFPGVIFYLTQWYPAARRSQVTALFMTGIAICGAAGSILSGAIMQSFEGRHGFAGWQWLFLIEAAPAVLVGLYILLRLDDDIAGAQWLNDGQKAQVARDLAHDSSGTPAAVGAPSGLATAVFRDPRVWLACLIYFCATTGLYGIGFWLPTIVAEMGIREPLHIGLLSAIPYAAAGVGMVLIGRHADRRREHRWHTAATAALGAVALAASALLSAHPPWAMLALVAATVGILATPPLFWSLPTAHLRGAAAATGIAFINSFGCLSGFVSPYLVGAIKDLTGTTNAGMYALSAFIGVGAILAGCWPQARYSSS